MPLHNFAPCFPTPPLAALQVKRKRKNVGSVKIVVAGCVAQQEGEAMLRRVPEVDIVMGQCNKPRGPGEGKGHQSTGGSVQGQASGSAAAQWCQRLEWVHWIGRPRADGSHSCIWAAQGKSTCRMHSRVLCTSCIVVVMPPTLRLPASLRHCPSGPQFANQITSLLDRSESGQVLATEHIEVGR